MRCKALGDNMPYNGSGYRDYPSKRLSVRPIADDPLSDALGTSAAQASPLDTRQSASSPAAVISVGERTVDSDEAKTVRERQECWRHVPVTS